MMVCALTGIRILFVYLYDQPNTWVRWVKSTHVRGGHHIIHVGVIPTHNPSHVNPQPPPPFTKRQKRTTVVPRDHGNERLILREHGRGTAPSAGVPPRPATPRVAGTTVTSMRLCYRSKTTGSAGFGWCWIAVWTVETGHARCATGTACGVSSAVFRARH